MRRGRKVSIQGNPFENQLERSRFAIKWGGILGGRLPPCLLSRVNVRAPSTV